MRILVCAIGAVLSLLISHAAAAALYASAIEYCGPGDEAPPVAADRCEPTAIDEINPQGRDIWIRAAFDAAPADIEGGPKGLFIAAKASSEAYLNGVRLGANGRPAVDRQSESPGRMDAVLAIPDGVLHLGRNEVAVRFSSHRGYLKLNRPVHWILIAPYAAPAAARLAVTWPALVALGVIFSGALYFTVIAMTGATRREPLLLAILSFFAAGQLIAEMARSLFSYSYPAHDLRLIAITATSAGFGLTLAALVISRFALGKARTGTLFGTAALVAAAITLSGGYDAKAGYAIFAGALVSVGIAIRAAMKGDQQGWTYATAVSVFAASILVFRGLFLDAVFFFEVAALLLVLFVLQALALERERREHALEQARAHELEAALQRAARSGEPSVVRVNSAGSINVVQASDITHLSGAGDYVELHLSDRRRILHNGALAQMETDLPPAFLRVHRSHIVNTDFVKTLTRESSGVGLLVLSNGAEVPVSRRIMPKVRSALVMR